MKKLFNVIGVATLSLMLAGQANAGRGGGGATPAAPTPPVAPAPGGIDLSWCRNQENCVLVKLAEAGQTGSLTMYSKTASGGYSKAVGPCPATGGVDNHRDGQRSVKTPAGTYGVIDTGDRLLYNGNYVNMYDPTYFKSFAFTSNRLAIHSGHVAGQNSHGCVRTTTTCADVVRNAADNSDRSMRIKIYY